MICGLSHLAGDGLSKTDAIVALGQPPHLSQDIFGEYEQKEVLEVSGPRVGKEFSRISFSEHEKPVRFDNKSNKLLNGKLPFRPNFRVIKNSLMVQVP